MASSRTEWPGPGSPVAPRGRWRAGRVTPGLTVLSLAFACGEAGPVEGSVAPAEATAPSPGVAPRPSAFPDLDAEAVAFLQRAADAVDRDPRDAAAWEQLARAYHAYRFFEFAREGYGRALQHGAEGARTPYLLAVVEEQLGDVEGALAHLAEAARKDPPYAPVHWRAGLVHLARGELEPAAAAFGRALEVDPTDPAATVGLARVHLQAHRPQEAIAVLESHLQRWPADDNARYLLGRALLAAGRGGEASSALQAAAEAEPLQKDPWLAQVQGLRRGKRPAFLEAVRLLDSGEVDAAHRRLEALYAEDPEDVLVLLNLHRVFRLEGDLDRALELLIEARRLDPSEGRTHLHLAGALREKAHAVGPPPDPALLWRALDSARRACELTPNYAPAHGMRGDLLHDLGKPLEAARAYAEAARLDSRSLSWHEQAGRAFGDAGHWADALPFFQELAERRPTSKRALFLWSAALANAGRPAEARGPLERALALAPDDPVLLNAQRDLERALATAESEGAAPRPPR